MSASNTSTVIGYIDIDAFECQLFQREEPQFRNCPCVVATQSGRLLSATYEAKDCGVSRRSTPKVKDALRVCPELKVFWKPDVRGKQDSSKTRHATWELLDAIKEFCSQKKVGVDNDDDIVVELASSDELYLDISAEVSRGVRDKKLLASSRLGPITVRIPDTIVWERQKMSKRGPFIFSMQKHDHWKQKDKLKSHLDYIFQEEERLVFGSLFMNGLCKFIEQKTGLASSGGVARNKLLAKVGCGINKPGKITICPLNSIDRVATVIPITSIPGLGGLIGEKLCKVFNVEWMSELRKIPLIKLEAEFDTELSQRIRSWAGGKDNQPVEARIMKDRFSCNKPSGSVMKVLHLEKTLKDLVEEMQDRLKEEKKRHRRVCNTIRVDLTFIMNPKQGWKDKRISNNDKDGPETISTSTAYDTNDKKFKMTKLQAWAFYFIKEAPGLDIDNFEITELGLTAKDFVSMDAVDGFQEQLEKLTLSPTQKALKILVKSNNTTIQPTYQSKTQIGSFQITRNEKYGSKKVRFPTIRPHNLLNYSGTYLGQGFELVETQTRKIILDHTEYYEIKHKCFLKWLSESKYFNTNFSKPDFIAFHGRIATPMQTPLIKQWGDWEIYAMNVGGIIFLWDQKEPQAQIDPSSYYAVVFRALVTNARNSADGIRIQEFDKAFRINEVSLGNHQIMMVNHVNAQDENGDFVQVSLFNENYWQMDTPQTKSRKLRMWTQALILGAKRIVVGQRDYAGILKGIDDFEIEEFRMSQLKDVDTSLCLQFENRLLDWIKLHLPVSNQKVVKKFSWVGGHQHVISDVVPQQEVSKLIVPRLYSFLFEDILKKS